MPTDDPSYKIPRLLRYRDLKERGVCSNWTTLLRWIKAGTFPAGRLIGPNTRVWTETELADWLASKGRAA
jgi:predicted DNA-binding transcriptional regulator AlpA